MDPNCVEDKVCDAQWMGQQLGELVVRTFRGVSLTLPLKSKVTSTVVGPRCYHQRQKIATMTRSRPIAPPLPWRPLSRRIASGDCRHYQYCSISVSEGVCIFTGTIRSYFRPCKRAIRRRGDNRRAPLVLLAADSISPAAIVPVTIIG